MTLFAWPEDMLPILPWERYPVFAIRCFAFHHQIYGGFIFDSFIIKMLCWCQKNGEEIINVLHFITYTTIYWSWERYQFLQFGALLLIIKFMGFYISILLSFRMLSWCKVTFSKAWNTRTVYKYIKKKKKKWWGNDNLGFQVCFW